jgi:uncharacterized SAM-binding protein YcdF (DUF218 family)
MRDLFSTLSILGAALLHRLQRAFRWIALVAGCALLAMVVLAFTRLPYDAHRWLGMAGAECEGPLSTIVILGGSGMPSGPELLRLHRAAGLGLEWPHADVFIVHPGAPEVLAAMKDELVWRGVGTLRVKGINAGENTREQALILAALLNQEQESVAVVTAPENMRRSVLALRAAGLAGACGQAAWESAMDHGFRYDHARIGGKPWMPDMARSTGLRYTFWNYLKLEVTCLREWLALVYYRLNGWI